MAGRTKNTYPDNRTPTILLMQVYFYLRLIIFKHKEYVHACLRVCVSVCAFVCLSVWVYVWLLTWLIIVIHMNTGRLCSSNKWCPVHNDGYTGLRSQDLWTKIKRYPFYGLRQATKGPFGLAQDAHSGQIKCAFRSDQMRVQVRSNAHSDQIKCAFRSDQPAKAQTNILHKSIAGR